MSVLVAFIVGVGVGQASIIAAHRLGRLLGLCVIDAWDRHPWRKP